MIIPQYYDNTSSNPFMHTDLIEVFSTPDYEADTGKRITKRAFFPEFVASVHYGESDNYAVINEGGLFRVQRVIKAGRRLLILDSDSTVFCSSQSEALQALACRLIDNPSLVHMGW